MLSGIYSVTCLENFVLKTEKNPTEKFSKVSYFLRKWQFSRVNILKIINSCQVKFSNVILFLQSFETWKHLKRIKDHSSAIFQNACLYL